MLKARYYIDDATGLLKADYRLEGQKVFLVKNWMEVQLQVAGAKNKAYSACWNK